MYQLEGPGLFLQLLPLVCLHFLQQSLGHYKASARALGYSMRQGKEGHNNNFSAFTEQL